MGHSYLELGNRYLHWPDHRLLLVFSLLAAEGRRTGFQAQQALEEDAKENLTNPITGVCDVNLDRTIAATGNAKALSALIEVTKASLTSGDSLSGQTLNKISLNAPDASFGDIPGTALIEWLDELYTFLEDK